MMALSLPLMVEGAVAILLAVTIGYCALLNRRLTRLQADRELLKLMIKDLVQATELANSAIKGLKDAAADADLTLTHRLASAERFAQELAHHVTAGQAVVERIAKITAAARPAAGNALSNDGRGAHAALKQLSALEGRRGNAA